MSDNISNEITEQILTKRVRCDYDLKEQEIMKLTKQNILNELEISRLKGKSIIFENQEIIASRIVTAFKDRKIINVMVISKTQSGKTGSMCAAIKRYLEDTGNLIPIEHIYIITGLSSCEWKAQTKERMPESIHARVFHRYELPNTFADEIKNKQNVLIIMDEIQVAAKTGQTIYKAFEHAGLLDKFKLYKNDIKILEYTATPDGTIYDLLKWKDASTKILAEGGDGYTSAHDLLKMSRVKQYKDLCGYNKTTDEVDQEVFENIQDIKDDIDKYKFPLYHIIRIKNGKDHKLTIDNFKQIFNTDNYSFIEYDGKSDIEDINKILILQPENHTFIFIKEMLRCSKTLKKIYIGILYDRYTKNPDDSTIIQGLVGRDTGYDNNGISICYTNIDSIIKYEQLLQSSFEDPTIKWNSNTTKTKNDINYSKNTFNNPENYHGCSVASDDTHELNDPLINIFKTQEDVKEYFKKEVKNLGCRGPNKRHPNKDGYYESTIRSSKNIYSCEDVKRDKKFGLTKNNYRYYPCYQDINDKATLQWWIIHYEFKT